MRAMSTAMLAAFSGTQLAPAIFMTATFNSGPVYLWTGYGPLVWNGQTWLGIGSLGSIGLIDEGSTVEAKGIALQLSGIDPVLLADVLGEFALGQPVQVFLGLFLGGELIASPVTAWSGRMDLPKIDIAADKANITINCESRLVDLNTACGRRYTQEDQQRDYPGDLFCMFVNSIQNVTIYWGTAPTSSGIQ